MSESVGIDLVLRGQTAGGTVVKRTLDDVGNAADKATGATDRLEKQMNATDKTAVILGRSLGLLAGAFGVRQIVAFADSITTLETRLRNVTQGAADFNRKFSELFAVAQRTGDSFKDVTASFVQLNSSLPDSVKNTTDLVKITELLTRGMAASGTSAQAAGDVMLQLTQGLSGNFASAAQEINSLIEGAPLLAKTIAEQLGGKAATDLKKFAEAGKLTTQSFLAAVLSAEKAIKSYTIPPTIERSWQRIVNEFTRLASESSIVEKASTLVATALDSVAKNMEGVIRVVTVATASFVAFKLASNAAAISTVATAVYSNAAAFVSLAAEIRNASGAMALFSAATMLNPIVLAVTALGGAMALLATQSTQAEKAMESLGTVESEVTGIKAKLANATKEETNALLYRLEVQKNTINGNIKEAESMLALLNFREAAAGNSASEYARIGERQTELITALGKLYEARNDIDAILKDPKGASKLAPAKEPAALTKEQEKAQKELTAAIQGSWTEAEKLSKSIEKMENMRGLANATGQSDELKEAIRRANVELEELRIKAERNGPVAKAFESLTDQIDTGMRESFREAFVASDGGWKSMLNAWKAGFKAFLAEIAYTALMRPIVLSVVGSIGSGIGLSSGALNQIMTEKGAAGIGSLFLGGGSSATGGGGLSLGGIGSIASGLLNGGLFSGTLGSIGQGIGNLINGQAWGTVYGPQLANAAGVSSLGTTLGSAFGNMGYGAIGGLGANLLGLGSNNQIVNMLSGGLGTLAGGAVGASLGTILGFAGGPIGAIAGGFLGTALGGLFGGGKPSDKAQWGGLDLSTLATYGTGGQEGKKYSQENATFRDSVLAEAANLAKLLQSVGGTTTGTVYAHIGSRDGLRLDGPGGANYGNDSAAFINAILQQVVAQTTGLNQTMQTILKNVGVSDTQKLAQALAFGQTYDALGKPAEDADPLKAALDSLKTQFDGFFEQAREYGLSLEPLTTEYEKQKVAVTELVKAQQAGFASLEAMKATFDSWLYDQSLSSTSSLSPLEKLTAAQGNFGGLLDAVRGGDASKTQELLQAGQQLLQLGQSMYASSVDFSLLEKFVRDSIGSVARQLGVPGYASGTMSARSGMAWVGERGPELVRFNGGERVYNAEESKSMARSQASNDARFSKMADDMESMNKSIGNMARQFGRIANKMIVNGGN